MSNLTHLLSTRYKGVGRPAKRDYKTLGDRHRSHIPTIALCVTTLLSCLYFAQFKEIKPFEYKPLVSPLPEDQMLVLVPKAEAMKLEQSLLSEEMGEPAEGWDGFVQAVNKVAPMYDFPPNVVLAQGALESARGKSTFAKERNNYLGIGAYDADPNQAFRFENSEQCVIQYMQIIKRNFPEAWANRDNPEELLKALKSGKKVYATDPEYVNKVMSMKEWSL